MTLEEFFLQKNDPETRKNASFSTRFSFSLCWAALAHAHTLPRAQTYAMKLHTAHVSLKKKKKRKEEELQINKK